MKLVIDMLRDARLVVHGLERGSQRVIALAGVCRILCPLFSRFLFPLPVIDFESTQRDNGLFCI